MYLNPITRSLHLTTHNEVGVPHTTDEIGASQNIGNEIKVELNKKIENKINYRGEILGLKEECLLLAESKKNDADDKIRIPIKNINKAKLIFSEKLLKL